MKKIKRLFNGNLLIDPIEIEKTSSVGFIESGADDKYKRGKVTHVDPDLNIEVGDIVVFDRHAVNKLFVEDRDLLAVHISGVFAIADA